MAVTKRLHRLFNQSSQLSCLFDKRHFIHLRINKLHASVFRAILVLRIKDYTFGSDCELLCQLHIDTH